MAAASGKLRVTAKQTKMKVPKRAQDKWANKGGSGTALSVNGMASSLAFTPVQGIELVNPEPETARRRAGFGDGERVFRAAGIQERATFVAVRVSNTEGIS